MLLVLSAAAFLFAYFVLDWSWWVSLLLAVGFLVVQLASERHPKVGRITSKGSDILFLVAGPLLVWAGNDDLAAGYLLGGIFLTVCGMGSAAYGSYNVWIGPKKRSKLWLLFPILLPGVGYIPLAVLSNKKDANWA